MLAAQCIGYDVCFTGVVVDVQVVVLDQFEPSSLSQVLLGLCEDVLGDQERPSGRWMTAP
jgi:hypothetical protein